MGCRWLYRRIDITLIFVRQASDSFGGRSSRTGIAGRDAYIKSTLAFSGGSSVSFSSPATRHTMDHRTLVSGIVLLLASTVIAQPSPDVQKRISAAIASAANESTIDYTEFVNPFIGTGRPLHASFSTLARDCLTQAVSRVRL